MIFDVLSYITTKKGEISEDQLDGVTPFMLNRWLSMSSKSGMTHIINDTINRQDYSIVIISDVIEYLYHVTPKTYERLTYIKKEKVTEKKVKGEELSKEDIIILARNNNISCKEVERYIDFLNTLDKISV